MLAGIFCVLGVVVLWSFTPTLVKIALEYIDPYTLSSLRLLQGLVLVIIVHAKQGRGFKKLLKLNRWMLIGGLGVTANYILFIVALNYTTAGTGGLIVQFQFVTLALLAWLVAKEPLAIQKIIGAAIVVAGVMLVFIHNTGASKGIDTRDTLGIILLIFAAIGWAVFTLSNKALSKSRTSTEILIPFFSLASIISVLTATIGYEARATIEMEGILSIVILGTGITGVGFILLTQSLRRLNASLVGALTSLSPLLNVLISHKILGEPLSTTLIFGGLLIVAGVLAIATADRKAV